MRNILENTVNEIISEFISEINKIVKINCIILFGSQARGDFTPYSDVDLILIGDFKEKFMKRASKLLTYNKSNLNIEIFCYTKKEFEKMFSDGNALILDAIYEGLPLKGDDFFKLYKSRFDEMIKKGLKRSNCTWILV